MLTPRNKSDNDDGSPGVWNQSLSPFSLGTRRDETQDGEVDWAHVSRSTENGDDSYAGESLDGQSIESSQFGIDAGGIQSVVSSDNSEVAAYWAYQTENDAGESLATNNDGITIVDSVDDGSKSYAVRYDHNMVLSLPRTDSFPSDVDSLDVSYENADYARNRFHQSSSNISESTATSSLMTWTRRFVTSTSFVLLLSVAAFCSFSATTYFAWQLRTWRESALFLEDELHRVKEEASHNKHLEELERQRRAMEEAQSVSKTQGNLILFEPESTPLSVLSVDNCWVKAQASISLGTCANEMHNNIKKTTENLSNGVTAMIDSFIDNMRLSLDPTLLQVTSEDPTKSYSLGLVPTPSELTPSKLHGSKLTGFDTAMSKSASRVSEEILDTILHQSHGSRDFAQAFVDEFSGYSDRNYLDNQSNDKADADKISGKVRSRCSLCLKLRKLFWL